MCVECSGGERIEAVEKYLHEKYASERSANVTKRGYVTRWAERIEAKDEWRHNDGQSSDCCQSHHAGAEDCGCCRAIVAFTVGDQQRNQSGRKGATQQQLVDHVGRVVGNIEGVGKGGLTDNCGKHRNTNEPSGTRNKRAAGHCEVAREVRALIHRGQMLCLALVERVYC